jgi:hypothetical protein
MAAVMVAKLIQSTLRAHFNVKKAAEPEGNCVGGNLREVSRQRGSMSAAYKLD